MKIAILGANGQVATETAIYLNDKGYGITGFVRNTYGGFLLGRFKINVVETDYHDQGLLRDQLNQFDLVLDFTYPSGYSAAQLPSIIKQQIKNIMHSMQPGAIYIYMSSIMAHGMPDGYRFISHYYLPKSTYSFIKRKAEKFVYSTGRKCKIKTYNFRLGQVHGLLQSVNAEFERQVDELKITVAGKPNELVNVIFIKGLVDCIEQVVAGKVQAGTYTIVNHPQWSLEQLYQYYAKKRGGEVDLAYDESIYNADTSFSFKAWLWRFLKQNRGLLETYVLFRFKSVNISVKARFRMATVRNIINGRTNHNSKFLSGWNLLGRVPTKVIENNSTELEDVLNDSKEFEKKIERVLNNA